MYGKYTSRWSYASSDAPASVAAASASLMIWASSQPVGAGIVSQPVASAVMRTCPYEASSYQASFTSSNWCTADAGVTESGDVQVTRIASTDRVPEIRVAARRPAVGPAGRIRSVRIRDPSSVPVTSIRAPGANDGNAPPRCRRNRSPPAIR